MYKMQLGMIDNGGLREMEISEYSMNSPKQVITTSLISFFDRNTRIIDHDSEFSKANFRKSFEKNISDYICR